ncbi:hypothetical protein [Aequorivita marisscotiae]|uniref:DUF4369 domain-containing protein n=1 Tax=Aequorivita marisscotiae TaxID=3040348 RepID=A0ABY8L124_9FLAO|nr:hypothetical protein [Aequorivita sp. Ant34-E75]WGF93672.1 hypothetical protein QCQ61_05645 [Aequorivita sp. Ant34-E75]
MKSTEKHIVNFIFSTAIFLVFGNVLLAHGAIADNGKATVISALQDEDQGKPFVFDAIAVGEVSQTVSQHEYLGLDLAGSIFAHQNVVYARFSSNYKCYYSSKDKRELIFKHLFPFHFFW